MICLLNTNAVLYQCESIHVCIVCTHGLNWAGIRAALPLHRMPALFKCHYDVPALPGIWRQSVRSVFSDTRCHYCTQDLGLLGVSLTFSFNYKWQSIGGYRLETGTASYILAIGSGQRILYPLGSGLWLVPVLVLRRSRFLNHSPRLFLKDNNTAKCSVLFTLCLLRYCWCDLVDLSYRLHYGNSYN